MIIFVVGVLSAFFLFASSIKILGWQKFIFETQLAMFVKYGLNRTIMRLVGFVELAGALLIWFQGSVLGIVGAALLFCTSIGAIACHLIWDSWKEGIPAMITATLSGWLLWMNWSVIASLYLVFLN